MPRQLPPLRIKYGKTETVFARDAVKQVQLICSAVRVTGSSVWKVLVNDAVVFVGTEAKARREYARALRYVQ